MDDCPEPKDWGKEPAPPKPPPAAITPPRKPAPEQPRKPAAHDGDAAERPAKPVRPKDFAKWKPDDYFVAQRDNDPRLLEAVSYLGQGFADKEKAAEILLKLLEGLPPSADSDDGPAGRGAGGDQLVEAIVAALAAIDTPSARRAIEQLAAGEFKTSDNRAAAAAAVAALLSRPSRENEDALFRVVTLAARPQPAGRKPAGSGRRADRPARGGQVLGLRVVPAAAGQLHDRLGDAADVVRRTLALPPGGPPREPGRTSRPLSERPAGSGRHRTVGTAVPRTEQRRREPAVGRSGVQRAEGRRRSRSPTRRTPAWWPDSFGTRASRR